MLWNIHNILKSIGMIIWYLKKDLSLKFFGFFLDMRLDWSIHWMIWDSLQELTWLTCVSASASSFWLIPQRLATLSWHLWWTFMAQSTNGTTTNCLRTKYTDTPTKSVSYWHCTFTLESLFDKTPQQTSTVVAKGGTHVVVVLETVGHVNFKALLLELWGQTGHIISMNNPRQRISN